MKKRISDFFNGAIIGVFLLGLFVFAQPLAASAQTSPFSQWMYARYGRNHYRRTHRRATARRARRHAGRYR